MRKGKVPYLEKVIQDNLSKISFAMRCYRQWATHKQLKPSQTAYMTQTKTNRRELQFSKSGDPNMGYAYRTHYISPVLSAQKKQKIQEKLSQPPELVVLIMTMTVNVLVAKKNWAEAVSYTESLISR
ncbi:MAG: hypothetical protein JSR33_01100, partial [Proteobacteria bacterium]|nr:hypothetical protein [Pseudomonadota bacterium]